MDGEMNYKEYYKSSLEKGLEYQDYVTEKLIYTLGISLSSLSSKKYQYTVGENLQGFEIKFDDKMADTGNVYIETAEKSNPDNPNYVASGIYRSDNTWLYLIGNYETIFVFGKQTLILMNKKGNFRKVETKTSQGFLIPKSDAKKYCLKEM